MDEINLEQYELQDWSTLVVQNAAGDADLIGVDGVNPVTIEVYGSGSLEAVKAEHRAGQATAVRMAGLMRGKVDPRASEKASQELVEKLVARTRAVNNFAVGARQLYSNYKLGYITKQVARHMDEDANFAKASPTT